MRSAGQIKPSVRDRIENPHVYESAKPRELNEGARFLLEPQPACRMDSYVGICDGMPPKGGYTKALVVRDGALKEISCGDVGDAAIVHRFGDDDKVVGLILPIFQDLMREMPAARAEMPKIFAEVARSIECSNSRAEIEPALSKLFTYGSILKDHVDADKMELAKLEEENSGALDFVRRMAVPPEDSVNGSGDVVHEEMQREYEAGKAKRDAMIEEVRARIARREAALDSLASLISDQLIRSERSTRPDDVAVALGKAGSISRALGSDSRAHELFTQARDIMKKDKNKYGELFYSIQSIATMSETDDKARKVKLAAIKRYNGRLDSTLRSLHLELGTAELHLKYPDGPMPDPRAVAYLKGHEAALRSMHADSLMVEVGVRARGEMESDDHEFERLHGEIISAMNHAASHPGSPREATSLTSALTSLEMIKVEEGAEDSRIGDLDATRENAAQMQKDVAAAEKMYASVGGKDDGAFAALLDSAYFTNNLSSGLPIDAVYSWWDGAYSKHSNVDEIKSQADSIRERAPHLFDADGNLKPRAEITPPADGASARELEEKLHFTNGGFGENMAIVGGSSMAMAAVGAKIGAGSGAACGPFAEICIPAGGMIGSIAGFVGGDKIVDWIHAEDIEAMESQNELAGTNLMRTNKEEAEMTEMFSVGGYAAGVITSGAFGGMTKASPWNMGAFARSAFTRAGWRTAGRMARAHAGFALREVAFEGSHTITYGRAVGHVVKAFFTRATPPNGPRGVTNLVDDTFELVWERMSPSLRESMTAEKFAKFNLGRAAATPKDRWRFVFQDMAERGDTILFKKAPPAAAAAKAGETAAAKRSLLGKFNDAVDSLGPRAANRFAEGRVAAMQDAVTMEVPEYAASRAAIIGRKELLRHAFRLESGHDFVAAAKKSAERSAFGKLWYEKMWTNEWSKLYRLGAIPAVADYAFLEQTEDGTEFNFGDGKCDTPIGVAGLISSTGYYSTRMGINSYNGSLLAGGFKAATFVGFQGMAGLAVADPDFAKLAGSQWEYLLVLPTTLMLNSGMHAKGGSSSLINAATQFPFLRRIPSLSAWTTMYTPKAMMSKPNWLYRNPAQMIPGPANVSGMGLSLGYTIPYIMGMTALFGKTLLGSDEYFVGQRGWKFFFVGTFLNPLQIALGGDSGLAQGSTRFTGILFDLIPAMSLSPYYNNKKILRLTLSRMARGEDVGVDVTRHFMSEPDNWMGDIDSGLEWAGNKVGVGDASMSTVNRTFDIVGGLKRDSFDITDTDTYHFGWRWEPDGVNAWLDAMEGYQDNGKRMTGAAEENPEKVYGSMAAAINSYFVDPTPWMGSEHRTRGMKILSIMTKWYAYRYEKGEKQFKPFAEMIGHPDNAKWRERYWDKIPEVHSRKEFLDQVESVQEEDLDKVVELLEKSYEEKDAKK